MTNKELKHYDNLSDDEIRANINFAEDTIKDLVSELKQYPTTNRKTNEQLIQRWEDKIELYEQILNYRLWKKNLKN